VTHKYQTGIYHVYIFDRYGARLRDKTLLAPNFIEGRKLGEEHKGDGSFTVQRVIYNSLDPHKTTVVTVPEKDDV
jgi:hypothetical protein